MVERILTVLPGDLRLPSTRRDGADPVKLARQIERFGATVIGMPPVQAVLAGDDELIIWDGVTRATRLARLAPDATIVVAIIDDQPALRGRRFPRVRDRL